MSEPLYRLLTRLDNGQDLVGSNVVQHLNCPAGPAYFEPIHALGRSQAKVQPQIVVRQIASPALHLGVLGLSAGTNAHPRTNPVAVAHRALRPH